MSLYKKYEQKKAAEFTRLVGVSYGTFQVILDRLKLAIKQYQDLKPRRRRGRKSSLSIEDQLLLTLIYLRHYHTFLSLAQLFGISESYAHKRYTFIVQRLLKALDLPNEQSLTLDNLSVAMDVSEQPLERPVSDQKAYYSGKKKQHTIKALLIVCLLTRLILSVRCAKGSVHDFKIFKNSNLEIHQSANLKVDKGFQGIQKLYANAEVPVKASKNHPLTKEQKKSNKQLASERIVIEHLNRECKIFRICKEQYRGKHKNYTRTWKLVAAIVNLKNSTQHLQFASL